MAIFIFVRLKSGFRHQSRYMLPCVPFVFIWISQLARLMVTVISDWSTKTAHVGGQTLSHRTILGLLCTFLLGWMIADDATRISDLISVVRQNGQWSWFCSTQPEFQHDEGDLKSLGMLTARLFTDGNSKAEVARELDILYETLRKAIDQGRIARPDCSLNHDGAAESSAPLETITTAEPRDKSSRCDANRAAREQMEVTWTRPVERVLAAMGKLP